MSYHHLRRLLPALLPLMAAGCALGPDYVRPELGLPAQYREVAATEASIADTGWWEVFKDEHLQGLVRTALRENKDLLTAFARIEEARGLLGITRSDQFPALDIRGSAARTDPPDTSAPAAFTTPRNDFFAALDLSWELDLWGKLRRATEAGRADLLAAEYNARAVVVTLVAEVASTYYRLLEADDRLKISQRTLANRRDATGIIRARFNQGLIPELDVNQAEIEELDALVATAVVERQIRGLENAMSVLTGRMPGPITRSQPGSSLTDLPEIPVGLPAFLLERRPDIAAAEQLAAAEMARIGVAEAQRLPSLGLGGLIGYRSLEEGDLFESSSLTWDIAGSLVGPLIDFGRSRSRVIVAEARSDQALRSFEQQVLRAVQEVDDALVAMRTYRVERDARVAQRTAATNAARLSRARYDDGVAPYLEVLDSERSLFEAELAGSLALQNYQVAYVQLYRALGGGWMPEPPVAQASR